MQIVNIALIIPLALNVTQTGILNKVHVLMIVDLDGMKMEPIVKNALKTAINVTIQQAVCSAIHYHKNRFKTALAFHQNKNAYEVTLYKGAIKETPLNKIDIY